MKLLEDMLAEAGALKTLMSGTIHKASERYDLRRDCRYQLSLERMPTTALTNMAVVGT
jgi:hypothetical protein